MELGHAEKGPILVLLVVALDEPHAISRQQPEAHVQPLMIMTTGAPGEAPGQIRTVPLGPEVEPAVLRGRQVGSREPDGDGVLVAEVFARGGRRRLVAVPGGAAAAPLLALLDVDSPSVPGGYVAQMDVDRAVEPEGLAAGPLLRTGLPEDTVVVLSGHVVQCNSETEKGVSIRIDDAVRRPASW